MPGTLNSFNAAAGAPGSPYLAVLSFLAKGTGNFVINDTNFPGLGKYLPGLVQIASGTAANVKTQISTDNGTTWKDTAAAAPGMVYADAAGVTGIGQGVSTSASVRIVISTGATDIFLFPIRT